MPQPRVGGRLLGATTQTATALAALGALIFTGVSLNVTQAQNAAQNDLAAQSQYTDRYTKAVDQLGQQSDSQLQIRLGGIYALERLAHDSPRDQPTIIEVLSAFIRSTAPHTTTKPDQPATCPSTTAITLDIQAALTVLGRRNTSNDNGSHIDLHQVCMPDTTLTNANLASVNLIDVDLTNADLEGANPTDADLGRANLTSTDLTWTDLTNANLTGTNLGGTNLGDANLTNAAFGSVNLSSTNLSHTNLTNANLGGADLTGTDLSGANLRTAYFGGANLTNANLEGANLTDTDLSGANLTGAKHDAHTITTGTSKYHVVGAWW